MFGVLRLFPRLKDRGPIEALCTKGLKNGQLKFPRLKDRGPIEARLPPVVLEFPPSFPRLKDRGPIEAYRIFVAQQVGGVEFPRLKDRGPIEAGFANQIAAGDRLISAVERPRPH